MVEQLKQHLPAILQGRPVLLAYLYGSASTGYVHPFTDVDIIVSRQRYDARESYADSLTVLAVEGVIPAAFLSTAHRMVRLRNRLGHLYWEVDPERLYEVLQHDLGDLSRFKAAVCSFVQKIEPWREEDSSLKP